MNEQPRYSMIIEWSDEDQVYVVSLPEWGPFAHTHGATYAEAVRNGQEVLQLLIESALAEQEELPAPHVFADAS
ncbi:MAG: type II toxin-antitoxin system HicB family antitoxin [Chloroflexota bacterium]